jgi:hypothetical protein
VLLVLVLLAGCSAHSNDCLFNSYDGSAPQHSCTTGLQVPYGLLKDTDQP